MIPGHLAKGLRRTVDFQELNKVSARQTHHTTSPFTQASWVPWNQLMSTLDAWNGYHSVPLRKKDRRYFTFITEFGRYRYKSAPQGWKTSGDSYTLRYDEIIANVKTARSASTTQSCMRTRPPNRTSRSPNNYS